MWAADDSKPFGAFSIPLNGSTSLSFTVHNNNGTNGLSGVGFSDTLPAGLVISTPNGESGACGGGTITAIPGGGTISLSGATLGGQCFLHLQRERNWHRGRRPEQTPPGT